MSLEAENLETPPAAKSTTLQRNLDISGISLNLRIIRFAEFALLFVGGPYLLKLLGSVFYNGMSTLSSFLAFLFFAVALFACIQTAWRSAGTITEKYFQRYRVVLSGFLLIAIALIANYRLRREALGSSDLVFFLLFAVTFIALIALTSIYRAQPLSGVRLSDLLAAMDVDASPRRDAKPINRLKGIGFFLAGVGVPAWAFIYSGGNFASYRTVADFVGVALLITARRYWQTDAASLLSVDKRPPVLLLRLFSDDNRERLVINIRQIFDFSLEARLAAYFMRLGPFIAVDAPQEEIVVIGAARAQLADSEWQRVVTGWIEQARYVVMIVGKTQWIDWELRRIIEKAQVAKLILLFPERASPFDRSQDLGDRLSTVSRAFENSKWSTALSNISQAGRLRAIIFERDGTITTVRSKIYSRDSIHLAAIIAHYCLLERALGGPGLAPAHVRFADRKWAALTAVFVALAIFFNPPLPRTSNTELGLERKAAEITRAADDFVALNKQSDHVLRESDPRAKALLRVIFDTAGLKPPGDHWAWEEYDNIREIVLALSKVGIVYERAELGADASEAATERQINRNDIYYAFEIGEFLDALLTVVAMQIDTAVSAQQAAWARGRKEAISLALLRIGHPSAQLVANVFYKMQIPGHDDDWRLARLSSLNRFVPYVMLVISQADSRGLQRICLETVQFTKDMEVQAQLRELANTLGSK